MKCDSFRIFFVNGILKYQMKWDIKCNELSNKMSEMHAQGRRGRG